MAHYLQSITPCLALGGELVYHRRPGEEGTVMSLAGKYTGMNNMAGAEAWLSLDLCAGVRRLPQNISVRHAFHKCELERISHCFSAHVRVRDILNCRPPVMFTRKHI